MRCFGSLTLLIFLSNLHRVIECTERAISHCKPGKLANQKYSLEPVNVTENDTQDDFIRKKRLWGSSRSSSSSHSRSASRSKSSGGFRSRMRSKFSGFKTRAKSKYNKYKNKAKSIFHRRRPSSAGSRSKSSSRSRGGGSGRRSTSSGSSWFGGSSGSRGSTSRSKSGGFRNRIKSGYRKMKNKFKNIIKPKPKVSGVIKPGSTSTKSRIRSGISRLKNKFKNIIKPKPKSATTPRRTGLRSGIKSGFSKLKNKFKHIVKPKPKPGGGGTLGRGGGGSKGPASIGIGGGQKKPGLTTKIKNFIKGPKGKKIREKVTNFIKSPKGKRLTSTVLRKIKEKITGRRRSRYRGRNRYILIHNRPRQPMQVVDYGGIDNTFPEEGVAGGEVIADKSPVQEPGVDPEGLRRKPTKEECQKSLIQINNIGENHGEASYGAKLKNGDSLPAGKYLRSANGTYIGTLLDDGDFVVYNVETEDPIWHTDTAGNGTLPYKVTLRFGNILAVTDSSEKQLYMSSNIFNSKAADLMLQNDGNLVIYDSNCDIHWSAFQ